MWLRLSLLSYCFGLVLLLVYSYTQVDLNLTLSSLPLYLRFQEPLTAIGYFNRPLSSLIYIAILILLHLGYFGMIHQSKDKRLTSGNIIKLLLTTTFLLLFAYPAFSYDLFNYIFDARILLTHQSNPLTHTALDFPADTWTRFMRWTHRSYPYGPAWLLITLPFYAIGLGKFVLTLISFKLLSSLSYLLACWSIWHFTSRHQPKVKTLALLLFAFNPLVIIESLVSSHLDITMAALAVFAFASFSHSRPLAWVSLVISGLVKFVTFSLLPFLIVFKRHPSQWPQILKVSIIFVYLTTLIVIFKREILPWYALTPFALTSLLPSWRFNLRLMLSLTPALLLLYLPYIYQGSYTPWVIQTRLILFALAFIFSFLAWGKLLPVKISRQ